MCSNNAAMITNQKPFGRYSMSYAANAEERPAGHTDMINADFTTKLARTISRLPPGWDFKTEDLSFQHPVKPPNIGLLSAYIGNISAYKGSNLRT